MYTRNNSRKKRKNKFVNRNGKKNCHHPQLEKEILDVKSLGDEPIICHKCGQSL